MSNKYIVPIILSFLAEVMLVLLVFYITPIPYIFFNFYHVYTLFVLVFLTKPTRLESLIDSIHLKESLDNKKQKLRTEIFVSAITTFIMFTLLLITNKPDNNIMFYKILTLLFVRFNLYLGVKT